MKNFLLLSLLTLMLACTATKQSSEDYPRTYLMEHLRSEERIWVSLTDTTVVVEPWKGAGEAYRCEYRILPSRKNDPVIRHTNGTYYQGTYLSINRDTFLAANWEVDYVD